jgi:hypothetical protein
MKIFIFIMVGVCLGWAFGAIASQQCPAPKWVSPWFFILAGVLFLLSFAVV